jgi:hypothetical protein
MTTLLLIFSPLLFGSTSPTQSGRATLLPETEAKGVSALCSRDSPKVDKAWTPADSELALMESHLDKIAKLRSNGGMVGVQIKHPGQSYRQYVGVMMEGHKYIYINGICGKPSARWRERLEDVCDGGCNWGVLYNMETHKFSDLTTKGVA